MPTVKLLKATTNLAVNKSQVPWFRGTMGSVAGCDFPLFHNHLETGLRWKYPLVQYLSHNGNGALIGINDGAFQILQLFKSIDINIVDINGDMFQLSIASLTLNEFKVRLWESPIQYTINDYLPLNDRTRQDYEISKQNNTLKDFMAKKLTGNILSLAKGIDWLVDGRISVIVKNIEGPFKRNLKGVPFLAFRVSFLTNVSLPTGIGLGKGSSMGFGRIIQILSADTQNG